MKNDNDHTLFFQLCRDISGRTESIGTVKRNGKRVACFPPSWIIPSFLLEVEPQNVDTEFLEEVCKNLTPLETETWLLILDRRSIAEMARIQGVTRTALYERIRGKNGRGGMIAKNRYVRLWWKIRQERFQST